MTHTSDLSQADKDALNRQHEAQLKRNAEDYEIDQTIGNGLRNHPLARIFLGTRKNIVATKDELMQKQRDELEKLAAEESLCLTYIHKRDAYEKNLVWPDALAESLDKIALNDDEACDRLLDQMHSQRGSFIIGATDLRELNYPRLAREMKPKLVAAMKRRQDEAKRAITAFEDEHRAVLKKHGLL